MASNSKGVADNWLTRRVYWAYTGQWATRQECCRRARLILEAGLFDAAYYRHRYPDVAGRRLSVERHYVDYGAYEDRTPNGVFDADWYSSQAGLTFQTLTESLLHFVTAGAVAGLSPSRLFDPAFYSSQYPKSSAWPNPLGHYLKEGEQKGQQPHPLFDPAFVRTQADDVVRKGLEPLTFFLTLRSIWLPNPHPLFDCAYYLRNNPEALRERINPLLHFLSKESAAADPHPLFNVRTFLSECRAASSRNPLMHYVLDPSARLCRTHRLFDPEHYIRQSSSAAASQMPALEHYLRSADKASPVSGFDPSAFLRDYPQVVELRRDPLTYFAEFAERFHLEPHRLRSA